MSYIITTGDDLNKLKDHDVQELVCYEASVKMLDFPNLKTVAIKHCCPYWTETINIKSSKLETVAHGQGVFILRTIFQSM